jgi:hypothetical protein
MGIAYKVNTLTALLYFVEVFNYIVTFLGGKAIEHPYVDNESLVPSVVTVCMPSRLLHISRVVLHWFT